MNYSQSNYDEEYYRHHCGGVPYERSEPHWEIFFGKVSDEIIKIFNPKTVFDAGCAKGFLVETLRKRHVEAYGRDFSEHAIHDIPHTLRPFCVVGSIADPIDGTYDLITCIEVLEHMPVDEGEQAIANLCRSAPVILFSSSPEDFNEPTHINVRTPLHWLKLFAKHNFGPSSAHDPSFLCSWAMILERRDSEPSMHELLAYAKLVTHRMEKQKDAERHHKELQDHHKALHELQHAYHETSNISLSRQHEIDLLQHSYKIAKIEIERLSQIENSTTWRMTAPIRLIVNKLRFLRRKKIFLSRFQTITETYQSWVERFDTLVPNDMRAMQTRATTFGKRPLISILVPTYNTPEKVLREAIDSVLAQTYDHWELCIADDASTAPHVRKILEEYMRKDPRVRVIYRDKNGHISAASNSALSLAQGDWIALLDHDDLLPPHALFCVVEAINRNPEACLFYSDEDKIDMVGKRSDPYFKSDWNELLFFSQNMFCHFGVIRADVMNAVHGFREGFEGAQDYDLILRCIENVDQAQIIHIPHILYHWRKMEGSTALKVSEKPYAQIAAQKALNEHFKRRGLKLESVDGQYAWDNRLSPQLDAEPSVTIIIPTRNGLNILRACVDSVIKNTDYKNYTILIVDNGSDDQATVQYLTSIISDKISVLKDDRPFNYSQLNNFAVSKSKSEYLCFLNNDTEVIARSWLKEMVGLAHNIPKAGVVGAKLLYTDRSVQHAGVILGMGGVAGHYSHIEEHDHGYFGRASLSQQYSAVTFACALVKRTIFEEVGGLDENYLKIAFNDIDFCLKVREAGYRNLWTPYALLLHHESKSRGYEDTLEKQARFSEEVKVMMSRWGHHFQADPAYSAHLSLEAAFRIAFPPRVSKPWL